MMNLKPENRVSPKNSLRSGHRLTCSCLCGETEFQVRVKPLMRAYCHCSICQEFNQGSYADITVFRSRDVIKPDNSLIEFKSYQFPPILQRGQCRTCRGATIEYLNIPFLPLVIVPTRTIQDCSLAPEPSLHMFYDCRVDDVQDNLPKYSGYIQSQYHFIGQLLRKFLLKNS